MPDIAAAERVRQDIMRALHRLTVVVVVLGVVVGCVAVIGYLDSLKTKHALCALRADLTTRIAGSEAFLAQHPHGTREIPAKLIRDGIENQRRTVRALDSAGLSCSS